MSLADCGATNVIAAQVAGAIATQAAGITATQDAVAVSQFEHEPQHVARSAAERGHGTCA